MQFCCFCKHHYFHLTSAQHIIHALYIPVVGHAVEQLATTLQLLLVVMLHCQHHLLAVIAAVVSSGADNFSCTHKDFTAAHQVCAHMCSCGVASLPVTVLVSARSMAASNQYHSTSAAAVAYPMHLCPLYVRCLCPTTMVVCCLSYYHCFHTITLAFHP